MITLEYNTTKDYSKLNPPKFVQINSVLNTVLIPITEISQNINLTDEIVFLYNRKIIKQKSGLNYGIVEFYNKKYYYFHIIPGFKLNNIHNHFEIVIQSKNILLNPYFDSSYTSKIINGLIVLPNNYNYMFYHIKSGIVLSNNKQIPVNIIKQENKYNYYAANTNNSLLHILDESNTNLLYEINSNQNNYIRPLFNNKYPLGSLSISSNGVKNSRIAIGKNIFTINNNLQIDNLSSGKYNIVLLDANYNPINIDYLNNINWNKNNFDVTIEQAPLDNYNKSSTIPQFASIGKPNRNLSNLLINLYPNNTQFEIFGPNQFYRKFFTGHKVLYNIEPGNYEIKFQNQIMTILVIKNDNNYFSNI